MGSVWLCMVWTVVVVYSGLEVAVVFVGLPVMMG